MLGLFGKNVKKSMRFLQILSKLRMKNHYITKKPKLAFTHSLTIIFGGGTLLLFHQNHILLTFLYIFFIKIQTCEGSFKTRLPFSVACFCIPHIIKLFPWNAHFQFICPHSDSLSKPLNKALELAQKQTSVTYLSRARCSKTLSTIQVNRVESSTSRSY